MDDKRLEEMEKGPYREAIFSGRQFGKTTEHERSELIRLARLGLWAEQRGIPALRYCEQANTSGLHSVNGTAADALASLKVRGVGV
jgi:hypothetical protein